MSFQNNNSNYSYTNSPNSWKKPASKKSYSSATSGGDSYQRFLEYLEESGQSQTFFIQSQIQQDKIKGS